MRFNRTFLLVACGMMDLTWLYAGSTFLTTAVLQHAFPFPEAVASFALAAMLTLFASGRGWRVITVVALQALLFIPALIHILEVFSTWSDALTHQAWLNSSFSTAAASQTWLTFMLLMVWIFFFWGGGMRLAWRTLDYNTVCLRFDRGLAVLFVLLLFKFMLRIRGGISVAVPALEYLISVFFIFSLLAIGLVRNQTTPATREFMPGYQGISVIIGFTALVLPFCIGLSLFFLPYLTVAAEKSYALLKEISLPFGSLFMIIIHFIFGRPEDWKTKPAENPPSSVPKRNPSGQQSWWVEYFGQILAWGVAILLALIVLFIIGISLYFLVEWLFSKTGMKTDRPPSNHPVALWMRQLRALLFAGWQQIVGMANIYWNGYREVKPLYGKLRTWGRRSGLPALLSETPTEYAKRLQHRFPQLKQEIAVIVDFFQEEVYGDVSLTRRQLALAAAAWNRLRHPRHWPRRLMAAFSCETSDANHEQATK